MMLNLHDGEVNIVDEHEIVEYPCSQMIVGCFSCLFVPSLIGDFRPFGKKRHGLFIKKGRDEVISGMKEISRSFSE